MSRERGAAKTPTPRKKRAPSKAKKTTYLGHVNNAWSWGSAVLGALGIGFTQWILGLPGEIYIVVAGLTLIMVLVAVWLSPNATWFYVSLAAYAAVLIAGTWVAYHQSRTYEVTYAGPFMQMDLVQVPLHQNQAAQSVQLGVRFNNPNNFPVTARSIRRYVSFGRLVSGDEGEDSTGIIPAHGSDYRVIDSKIVFPGPYEIGRDTMGYIDFAVCFARDPEGRKFDKMFRMKGRLVFAETTEGVQGPDFSPTEPADQNFGFYKGCNR